MKLEMKRSGTESEPRRKRKRSISKRNQIKFRYDSYPKCPGFIVFSHVFGLASSWFPFGFACALELKLEVKRSGTKSEPRRKRKRSIPKRNHSNISLCVLPKCPGFIVLLICFRFGILLVPFRFRMRFGNETGQSEPRRKRKRSISKRNQIKFRYDSYPKCPSFIMF